MANKVVDRWPYAWAVVLVASLAVGSSLSVFRMGGIPLYAGMAGVEGMAAWLAYRRYHSREERLAGSVYLASMSLPLIALFAAATDVASRIARTIA